VGKRPDALVVIRNRCDRAEIDSQFGRLIDAAVAAYVDVWPDEIVEIRLLGSVARGEAAIGKADIDFMALLTRAADPAETGRLAEQAEALRTAHPVVTRVELDAEAASALSEFQRFVLSSDSLSLSGRDELTRPVQTVERGHLARLVTPGVADLIDSYRGMVEAAADDTDEDELRFYSRVTGKDLLKCLRFVILLRGGDYEPSIDGIYRQVSIYAPEFSALADELYRLYREPTSNRDAMLKAVSQASATLLPTVLEAW
jgi:predicted nucleotidyltransferase